MAGWLTGSLEQGLKEVAIPSYLLPQVYPTLTGETLLLQRQPEKPMSLVKGGMAESPTLPRCGKQPALGQLCHITASPELACSGDWAGHGEHWLLG